MRTPVGHKLCVLKRDATLSDLEALGEQGRAELIDGVLYQLPMTSFEHGHIASMIVMALGPAYQLGSEGPGGWWVQAENDFAVEDRQVYRPDAIGWRKARLLGVTKQGRADVVTDLTVLVGPHATGKSLVLQRLKLAVDGRPVAEELERHGFAGAFELLRAVFWTRNELGLARAAQSNLARERESVSIQVASGGGPGHRWTPKQDDSWCAYRPERQLQLLGSKRRIVRETEVC